MQTRLIPTRCYEAGDLEDIISLLKQSFPEWQGKDRAREYWEWKYLDAPFGANVSVATSEGRVIGAGHEINLRVKVGSNIYYSQYSDDYATLPEFRGMGIYKKLVDEVLEKQKKTDFTLWLTRNPIVIKDSENRKKSTTFNFPYTLTHLFRIDNVHSFIDSNPIKNKFLAKGGITAYQTFNKLDNLFADEENEGKGIEVESIKKFNDEYLRFWDWIKVGYYYISEKTPEFLNWRYMDPRAGEIVTREARQGGEIVGFSVLETRRVGGNAEGYIIDLLSSAFDVDVRSALIKDACRYFKERGISVVHFQAIKDHPNQKIARRYGFIEPPGVFPLYLGCEMMEEYNDDRLKMEASQPERLHFVYGSYF